MGFLLCLYGEYIDYALLYIFYLVTSSKEHQKSAKSMVFGYVQWVLYGGKFVLLEKCQKHTIFVHSEEICEGEKCNKINDPRLCSNPTL